MHPLCLDEYRDFFKDDASFEKFVEVLATGLSEDLMPVMSRQKVLGAVLSPAATKEVLYERMIRKISDCPSVLDEIKDRIENDDIVE